MIINFKNVSKSFGSNLVIENLTSELSFNSLAIIGPSGSGKSTLLRLLGGLIDCTQGEILVDAQSIPKNEKDLLEYRKSIGFVFQTGGLFPHLSALQNITLPLIEVHRMTKESAERMALSYLDRFGLSAQAHQSPLTLSGGQQQRIAIIRAILHKPKLLLLDEPTSALDPDISVEVYEMLQALIQEGIRVIIVTHHLGFAKNVCDQVIFVDEKTIVEAGPSKDLFISPKSSNFQHFLKKMREFD